MPDADAIVLSSRHAGRAGRFGAERASRRAPHGEAPHRLIAEFVAAGLRAPSPVELLERVAQHPTVHADAVVYRQAAKQTLATTLAIYFRYFAYPTSWRLVGCELPAGRCRFDLVFERPDGKLVADELKTGRVEHAAARDALEAQLRRELTGGQQRWGDRFAGVRVILLGAPRRSFFAHCDGPREALPWQ